MSKLVSARERRHERRIDRRDFDLQFFAAEDEGRTEDPTEKRRDEARSEGQIPRTEELSGALIMGAGFFLVWIYGSWMLNHLLQFSKKMIGLRLYHDVNPGNVMNIFRTVAWTVARVVYPVAVGTFIAGALGHLSQVGFMFITEPMKPDLSMLKFSGSELMEKLTLSKEVAWDLFLSISKLVIVGLIGLEVIYSEITTIILLVDMPLFHGVSLVLSLAFEIIWKTVLFLLLLSVPDWAFQKYQHEQELKMTPQQKDDERKQQEGDPEIQKRQQEKMQENMQQRVEEEVPEADVVITNPTHYAVALVYDEMSMEAPKIIAKGEDMLAQRIRQLARENNVPIYEVPLLARTLFQLEVDQEIPPQLYDSVATVLAWVERNREDVDRSERAQLEQKVEGLEIA